MANERALHLCNARTPPPSFCTVARTKDLATHCPQSSRNKWVTGKVAQTKKLDRGFAGRCEGIRVFKKTSPLGGSTGDNCDCQRTDRATAVGRTPVPQRT